MLDWIIIILLTLILIVDLIIITIEVRYLLAKSEFNMDKIAELEVRLIKIETINEKK